MQMCVGLARKCHIDPGIQLAQVSHTLPQRTSQFRIAFLYDFSNIPAHEVLRTSPVLLKRIQLGISWRRIFSASELYVIQMR